MDALIVSDLHYVRVADHVCTIPERQTSLALDLCQRAYETLCKQGIEPDLAIVLGDVVDDGTAEGAAHDLEEVARTMRVWGIPVLAVPGNHDGDGECFAEIFGCSPGLHTVDDVGFLLFEDSVGEGHVTTRPERSLCLPGQVAAELGSLAGGGRCHCGGSDAIPTLVIGGDCVGAKGTCLAMTQAGLARGKETPISSPRLRLVGLQHNPVYPPIDREYPFLLSNADAVVESYRQAGVILSLSGHYHPGQAPSCYAGVTFYTAPALCEYPFRFAHLRIEGQMVTIEEFALQ